MRALLRITRPFTLLPPMLGMATGAAAAHGALGTALDRPGLVRSVLLGILMAGTLNAASNVINQIFDLAQDRINKPERPLPSGALSIRAAWVLGSLLYLAALTMAWFVEAGAGHECFFIVLFTTFVTYAYSGPPFRWRRFGWRANLTVALPRGLLLKVAGWSSVAPVFSDPEPWCLGLVFFLFLLGATTTKDYADLRGDREAGVRNLPIRLGVRGAMRVTAPFFVLPWLLLILAGLLPDSPLSAPAWALIVLGSICSLYGAFLVRLLMRDPEALARTENHPAWTHMYLLMMTAQFGSALIYQL
ncbi:MAG: UbiA family prenyltransferase [Planctomycetes bacterium]|nr:UbiA family prenyltransferase [Planctomycetota bacterium]